MKKRLLFLILCCVGMLSCNKSDIPDDLDKNPIFKFTKEKKYFDEFHTYSDVFKLYYYEHDVIQTNPNAIFPAEQISKLKDSLNYRLSKSEENKRDFFLEDVGIEINGKPVDMVMHFTVFNESKVDDYMSMGRDKLIDIWKKVSIRSLFASFEDFQNYFALRMWTTQIDDLNIGFKLNKSNMELVNSQDYFQLVGEKPSEKPTINLTQYYWTYDRFNNRTYTDDEGNTYTTKVVVKKLEEVVGYDDAIEYTNGSVSSFDLTHSYPIIQFYKGNELWFEGLVFHYAEDHEECNDGIDTILSFSAHTKKDGYYWELNYEWIGYSRFQLRKLDFTKPTENADFTDVETINIKIVKDEKEGHKGTGSFDNGKGKTFNFNAGYE